MDSSDASPDKAEVQVWLAGVMVTADAARKAQRLLQGSSKNTLRALRSDFTLYQEFCDAHGLLSFPVGEETCCRFLTWCANVGKAPATLRRYIASLSRMNRIAGHESLAGRELIKATMRSVYLRLPKEQGHAKRLGWDEFSPLLRYTGSDLRILRDRALVCVGYDALLRRSEIVGINVEDISIADDGTGTLKIQYSKADQEGAGSLLFLTKPTVRAVLAWQVAAGLTRGALFRRLRRRRDLPHAVEGRLSADAVADILEKTARRLGLAPDGISGHSLRVGAMEDLVKAGVSTPGVMNAARLASERMVTTYTRGISVTQGAVAAVANHLGRNV